MVMTMIAGIIMWCTANKRVHACEVENVRGRRGVVVPAQPPVEGRLQDLHLHLAAPLSAMQNTMQRGRLALIKHLHWGVSTSIQLVMHRHHMALHRTRISF